VSIHSKLETHIGYAFSDTTLLARALTHASMHDALDNERMEFLGDRMLGLAMADLLYRAYPDEDEGHLAKRHTALVQKQALVRVSHDIDLGGFLRLSAGEMRAGGLKKDTILADALEALIGAIFIDGGYAAAAGFIEKFWAPLLNTQATPPQDAKTTLQEWAQAKGLALPEYKMIGKSGADHAPVFDVEVTVETLGSVRATASSKRAAEKEAAVKMLERTVTQS
jgi:ribonuclease III